MEKGDLDNMMEVVKEQVAMAQTSHGIICARLKDEIIHFLGINYAP